jgi:diguanylate cyclase (GGDEF)-like protein
MDTCSDQSAFHETARLRGDQGDIPGQDLLTETPRTTRLNHQFRWLLALTVTNFATIAIDWHRLDDSFPTFLGLRLLVITPLLLLALAINRWSNNHQLQVALSAAATVSLVAITASVAQLVQEPFASRYMMVAGFGIFAAAVFAALPWRATQLMTGVSIAAYTVIVASGLQFPPRLANFDLIVFNMLMAALALSIRRQNDVQMHEILSMRRIDAERTAELHSANARLSQLSSTDALTGAFNRRHLDMVVDNWSTSIVPSRHSGVLMIDVDHFKLFNDHGGHALGDRCLQLVVAAIRAALRSPDDIVVRYGGEEFVVILPAADLSETLGVAERLRRAVADLGIPHPGREPGAVVTVSVGACVAAVGENLMEAIKRADKLLYTAKEAGRDRVSA